jgi:hypothetical protein
MMPAQRYCRFSKGEDIGTDLGEFQRQSMQKL